jgi:hypothetical protein
MTTASLQPLQVEARVYVRRVLCGLEDVFLREIVKEAPGTVFFLIVGDTSCAIGEPYVEVLAQRIFTGKVLAGEGLADDGFIGRIQ